MGDYDEFHDPVLRRKAVQARLNEAKAAGEWIPPRWHEVEPGVWEADPAPSRVRSAPRRDPERSLGQALNSALDRLPPAVAQVLLLLALVGVVVLMLWVFSYPCPSQDAADCGMW